MLKTKTLTISNVLSLLRVMLLVPIFQGLSQNTPVGTAWALFYMFIAVLTDFLDGFLARRLDQISDLGKVLDPLADKICIFGVALILTVPIRENPLPTWFLLVIMVREIGILGGGYFIYRRQGIVLTSNIWGKSTSTIIAAMLFSYVINFKPASPWLAWMNYRFLLWLSVSFIIVSALSYTWRFLKLLNAAPHSLSSEILKAKNRGTKARAGSKIGES